VPDARQPVRLARRCARGFRRLGPELAAFGLVSAVALLVADIGITRLLQAGVGPLAAYLTAAGLSAAVSYLGNRYWTFRHRRRGGVVREGSLFLLLTTVGLVVQDACLNFSISVLSVHDQVSYDVAVLASMGLGSLFRFWSFRTWVWKPRSRRPGYAAGGA
jgi:putative flippase GtrA